jgi:hypothetical protein
MHALEPGLSLVIGAPRHALGELLIDRLAAEGRPIVLLVDESELELAHALTRRLAPVSSRLGLLVGDPSAIDLGFTGAEYLSLRRNLREVHHLIAPPSPRSAKRRIDPVRVVREVLELGAAATSLERITFWSSVLASGKRHGSLRERPYHTSTNVTETGPRAVHRADLEASDAIDKLPITLLRTGTVVLEPRLVTEESLGAARLLILYLLTRGRDPLFFMPGRADGVLSFIPAEYAVTAGLAIARSEGGADGIFHLVDSDPPTVRRAISVLCTLTGNGAPRLFVPSLAATALLRAPGLSPRMEQLRTLLDELGSSLEVSDVKAREILEPMGIVCPAFESYAERLVDEVREQVHDARMYTGGYEHRVL